MSSSGSQANAEQSRRWPFFLVAGLSDATIFALLVWKRHIGILNNQTAIVSGWIAVALFSAVWIASLWRKRRLPGQSKFPVSAGILVMGLITGLLTTVVVRSMPSADITFALSRRPLDEISSPQRRLLIGMLRESDANSREYASIAAHTEPLKPPLYSAESFAGRQVVQRTVDRLHAAYEQDQKYAAKQQTALRDFEAKMGAVDRAWLESWKRDDLAREAAQNQQLELEKQWMTSATALYGYAMDHSNSFQLVGGVLKFSSPAIENQFREQMEASKGLQQRMQEKMQQLTRDQQTHRHADGLN